MDELGTQDIAELDPDWIDPNWVDHPDSPAKYWESGLEFPLPDYMKKLRSSPDDVRPPREAPTDGYTLTYEPPLITKPIGLASDLKREFGKSGKLSDYYLTTTDIPSQGTIKLSDFDGISGTVKIVGDLRIDRWDDLTGGGLFANANRTWNNNFNNGIPMDKKLVPAPNWTNAFNNNFWLLYELANDWSRIVELVRFTWRGQNKYYTKGDKTSSTVINLYALGLKDDGSGLEDVTKKIASAPPTNPMNDVQEIKSDHYYINQFTGFPYVSSFWTGSNSDEKIKNMKKSISSGCLFRHNMPAVVYMGANYTSIISDFKCNLEMTISLKSNSRLARIAEHNLRDRKDELLVEVGVDTKEIKK